MKNLIPIAIGSRAGCFARRISLSIVSNGKELRLDHDWNLGRSAKSTKRQVKRPFRQPWWAIGPWKLVENNFRTSRIDWPRVRGTEGNRLSSHDDYFSWVCRMTKKNFYTVVGLRYILQRYFHPDRSIVALFINQSKARKSHLLNNRENFSVKKWNRYRPFIGQS